MRDKPKTDVVLRVLRAPKNGRVAPSFTSPRPVGEEVRGLSELSNTSLISQSCSRRRACAAADRHRCSRAHCTHQETAAVTRAPPASQRCDRWAAKQHHGKSLAAACRRRERPRRTGATRNNKAASVYSPRRPLDAEPGLRKNDRDGPIPTSDADRRHLRAALGLVRE